MMVAEKKNLKNKNLKEKLDLTIEKVYDLTGLYVPEGIEIKFSDEHFIEGGIAQFLPPVKTIFISPNIAGAKVGKIVSILGHELVHVFQMKDYIGENGELKYDCLYRALDEFNDLNLSEYAPDKRKIVETCPIEIFEMFSWYHNVENLDEEIYEVLDFITNSDEFINSTNLLGKIEAQAYAAEYVIKRKLAKDKEKLRKYLEKINPLNKPFMGDWNLEKVLNKYRYGGEWSNLLRGFLWNKIEEELY